MLGTFLGQGRDPEQVAVMAKNASEVSTRPQIKKKTNWVISFLFKLLSTAFGESYKCVLFLCACSIKYTGRPLAMSNVPEIVLTNSLILDILDVT